MAAVASLVVRLDDWLGRRRQTEWLGDALFGFSGNVVQS